MERPTGQSISHEELLKVLQARLQSERKALETRLAENAVQAFLVTLEGRYGPIADDSHRPVAQTALQILEAPMPTKVEE